MRYGDGEGHLLQSPAVMIRAKEDVQRPRQRAWYVPERMFGLGSEAPLRVSHGARLAVERRCAGACESCGLEWPWALYLFLIESGKPAAAGNLKVLCARCSQGLTGAFAPLLSGRSLRERLRDRNNGWTGATKLTEARRRLLIAKRGGRCEACGIPGSERQLHVHHRLGVFRGGDDAEANLMVLCFACHHHLRPCTTGCGGWAKMSAVLCRHCRMRQRLQELYPGETWEEIKGLIPGLADSWPAGYEPKAVPEQLGSCFATEGD